MAEKVEEATGGWGVVALYRRFYVPTSTLWTPTQSLRSEGPEIAIEDVPQGVDESAASSCVALVTMTNDFTHRLLMKDEYANRVGPYGAKAPRPFAPVAVTPAALSDGGARNYVPGSTCR